MAGGDMDTKDIKNSNQGYFIENAFIWAKRILIIGNLLLSEIPKKMKEEEEKFSDREKYLDIQSTFEKLNEERIVNKHFFTISMNQFVEWLEQVSNKRAKEICKIFKGKFKDYKDSRDMHEHTVKYIYKEGKKQSQFIHEDKTHGISCDATSTVHVNEGYLIGKINANEVIAFIEKHINEIEIIKQDIDNSITVAPLT